MNQEEPKEAKDDPKESNKTSKESKDTPRLVIEDIELKNFEKRELFAALILSGLMASPERRRSITYAENNVHFAIWYADKLIEDLKDPTSWEPDPDFLSDYLEEKSPLD